MKGRAFAGLLLALVFGACGDAGTEPGCDDTLEVCTGGSGGSAMAGPPCDEVDHPCADGHECVLGVCDERCDDALCKESLGERAECRGGDQGVCRAVSTCGRTVACASTDMVCDGTSLTCFPAEGDCTTTEDCPLMFEGADGFGLVCKSRFCRFPKPMLSSVANAPGGLQVLFPAPGQVLDSPEAFEAQLSGGPGLYVVVVTDVRPRSLADLKRHATWVATILDPSFVGFADGASPSPSTGGESLPSGKPLFLTALSYEAGRLTATSESIPFAIGNGWKHPGVSCEDPGVVDGSCGHPERLQGCNANGRCGVVCASHRDCPISTTSGVCAEPDATGIRFCILQSVKP